MGGRNDNSPDTRRKLRPLSIISEEDGGQGLNISDKAGDVNDECFLTNSKHVQTIEKRKSEDQAPVKRRRLAVAPEQHPVNELGELAKRDLFVQCPNHLNITNLGTEGDLTKLKDTATKLNLKTRRASYLTWKAQYLDKPRAPAPEVKVINNGDDRLTPERKENMNTAIQWIRNELIDLRRQDQSLARQLLGIRHQLSRLRLSASCEEHQELLEEAKEEMDELRELSRFVDLTPDLMTVNPLRQIGVTKMNITSRRFSTC